MDADESSPSSLCARLYHVILDAFRYAISRTRDAQLLSKLQSCGQRFKLWAAGLHVESGDLDAQLDEDAEMKDSVLLLLGLILYDLYRTYKHIRQSDLVSNHGDSIDARGSSPLSAHSLQNSNHLYDTILEHNEEASNLPQAFGPNNASVALSLRLTDDPQIEDHAHWISSLTYICPSLESFVIDSALEGTNGPGPSDIDSEELVIELVEDIVDTVQQLYDLGPSLAWEITLPKTLGDSESERHIEAEDSLEAGVIHYLHLTQDMFSHISHQLALRLAKANWVRFQRLETARATASAERAALASRTIREKSYADSGYSAGSKSSTVQGQDGSAQSRGPTNGLDHMGTEYGSVYSSMDRFGAHGRLRFPVPPVEQLGLDRGKFDCTVCGSTVGPFRDKRGWRLHVVRDLAPYICPNPECKSEQFVFESQHSFTAHLRSCHDPSSSWRCKFPHCDTSFSELRSFQDHLCLLHGISEEEDSEHLCNAWKESTRLGREEISCQICKGVMNASLVQQSKHLGRHMIEIALLSIPNHSLNPDELEESDTSELSADHPKSKTDKKGEANTAGSAQKSTSRCGPPDTYFSHRYDKMERVISRRSTFDRALADFAAKAHEFNETAVDGRSYVLVEKLQKWMREPSLTKLDNKFVTNTDLLAHAAYSGRSDFPPIEPSRISDSGTDCCVIVFSILLDLGLGHLIGLFSKKTIVDRRLPEDLSSLKRKLKGEQDGEQVAERFNERQWKFCPAVFSLNMENEYFEDRIIPICRKTHINSAGTAHVWQIVVQSEFVDKRLRNLLAEDAFASYVDKDYGPCYTLALKTFEEGNFQYYYDEKAAFDGLRGNRGVIRRLGCYSHRLPPSTARKGHANAECQSVEGKITMNLVLEYGAYDLRLIFGDQLPPVFPKEILAFWETLFEVADAVYGIHEFKTGGSEFNGWHADIKPENIIYVRGKYKLADPGFARFKKKPQDKATVPQIRLHGGTDTYGAPELSSQATVHQTIDTWSLGCVFSMAATWLILGYQGVCQYQLVREKALGSLLRTIKEDSHPLLVSKRLKASAKPGKLDCFHNGTDVLTEITTWHTLLGKSARKTDPITEEVLKLIDQRMLLQDPKQRVESKSLREELQRIVSSSKKALRDVIAAESPEARDRQERMEGLLYEIDKEAATQVVQEAPPEPTGPRTAGLPVDRDALKVQLERVALKKTSHRFETIIVTSDTMGVKGVLHRSETQPEYTVMSAADKRKSFRRSTTGQPSRTDTGTTTLTYQRTGIEPPTHAIQNVIQARESMKRELKRKGASFGKKKPRKDEYLSKHFKDRDIKFLVDDANTMSEHWDEATFLLETLVMKAHGQDPDGPDMTFTNDRTELKKEKDATNFRRAMQKVRPRKDSHIHTNIKTALTPIFNNYLSMVKQTHDKSKVNALTVIILTDGLWMGMADKNEIIPKIVQFYQQLTEKMDGMMKDRQVSIQFIQFGDDEEARERLRRLDDDMPFRGVDDVIDFEKFSVTGNVFKMLLGSFVEEMDAINDSVEDLSSPDKSLPSQATGSTPTKNLPLRSISEERHESLPSTARHTYSMQQAQPVQQKAKQNRTLSTFFSRQS